MKNILESLFEELSFESFKQGVSGDFSAAGFCACLAMAVLVIFFVGQIPPPGSLKKDDDYESSFPYSYTLPFIGGLYFLLYATLSSFAEAMGIFVVLLFFGLLNVFRKIIVFTHRNSPSWLEFFESVIWNVVAKSLSFAVLNLPLLTLISEFFKDELLRHFSGQIGPLIWLSLLFLALSITGFVIWLRLIKNTCGIKNALRALMLIF